MPWRLLYLFLLISALSLGPLSDVRLQAATQPYTPVSPSAIRQEPDPNFISYTLKSGTALQILLQTPLDTAINQAKDPVEGIMSKNLYLGNELVLSKNTRFLGEIVRLEPPLQGRDALLEVRFTEILLDNGEKLPIEAHIRTEHPEHIWGGQVTPGTKPMKSIQRIWGIGEYTRTVWGGPRAMGQHVTIQPGEHWTMILEQPLTLVKPQAE